MHPAVEFLASALQRDIKGRLSAVVDQKIRLAALELYRILRDDEVVTLAVGTISH
jgi:hypothetical protein